MFEFVGDKPGLVGLADPDDGEPAALVVEDLTVGSGVRFYVGRSEVGEGPLYLLVEKLGRWGEAPKESLAVGDDLHIVEADGVLPLPLPPPLIPFYVLFSFFWNFLIFFPPRHFISSKILVIPHALQ